MHIRYLLRPRQLIIASIVVVSVVSAYVVRGLMRIQETPTNEAIDVSEQHSAPDMTDKLMVSDAPHDEKPAVPVPATDPPAQAPDDSTATTAPDDQAAHTPVYQVYERFDGHSLDTQLWEAITYPKGYRNNEEQAYMPSQVRVSGGTLQLVAEKGSDGEWLSGEVHSKWDYLYGEFEVRMRVSATGPGVWPAAWLMGTTDHWPNGGELDIVENVNGSSDVHGTIHGGGTLGHWQLQKSHGPIDITQFHIYKIVKEPGVISWWVDGIKRGEWREADLPAGGVWPFESHRNFGLLNLAIGGTWPGPTTAATPNPITMYVDYFTVKNGR